MNKYENFSKEDLIELLNKQDKELKRKKYGLSWDAEKEPEQVVVDCQNNLPVLKNINSKNIISDDSDDFNIMIEGDNYHALQVLSYTHKEKIDVIYIDPPYNTGNKDFKYNDRFVEKEDGYRHSKWLNFMEKRLDLAKELLKDSGVIFISIDDNEQANLKLLCDKIFGENNFIGQFIWNKKNVVQNDAKFASTNHEYIIVYRKNEKRQNFILLPRTEEMNARYSNPDNDPRGLWTSVALQAKSGSKNNLYEIILPNGVKWKPVDGTYPRLSKESLIRAFDENRLWFGQNGNNVPRLKKYLNEVKQGVVTNSILLNEEVGSTQLGKETLKKIVNSNLFETPKPVELMKRCINLSIKKSGIILDFFAGSGTTAHAVLSLNKEDNGNRKFIVCTNNENNIAEEVCYPRIQKVIQGYTKAKNGEKIDGLEGNLKYFKTDFVKNTGNQLKLKLDITKKCTQMLCLKNNIFNLEQKSDNYKIFSNNNKNRYVAIYYNFYDDDIDEFINNIKQINKKTIVYIFSLDNYADKEHFRDYKNIKVEPIPQQILDVYSKIQKEHID